MTYLLEKKGKALIAAIVAGWISFALILFFTATLYAQVEPFNVSSPPNPVGSGARAMGMGGAFVAVADDATAASWNPAGLIHLQKPEVSAVYSLERHIERRHSLSEMRPLPFFSDLGEEEDKYTVSDLNYLSMAYPFNLARRNLVFSLNYQRLYDFTRELHYQSASTNFDNRTEYTSKGTLYTLSPALAIQTTENLFLGVTINIWSDKWTGRNYWERTYKNVYYNKSDDTAGFSMINEQYRNFRALNANFGLLCRITPQWTLGAVFKSPFRGKFDYIYYNSDETRYAGWYGKLESIDFPPTYALGMSYRFSDAWSISSDITRKDWDDLVWKNNKGQSYSLFTEFYTDPNTKEVYPVESSGIDPTYAFRVGIEYLKILKKTVIPFRGGIFYDPIPSVGSPHSEYGISAGSGISLGDLIMDFAYQYRVRSNVPGTETSLGYKTFEDKKQHIFLFSTIYHF